MQNKGFNPRTYIRYDSILLTFAYMVTSFNPRTYIRYDQCQKYCRHPRLMFQSTYLYKVRHFQPVLYSVALPCFNPRTYIRYDESWAQAYTHVRVSIHVPI